MGRIEDLLNEWKNTHLTKYCNNCDGHCCSLQLTELTKKNVVLLAGIQDISKQSESNLREQPYIKEETGKYKTDYADNQMCPQNENGNCKVYTHPDKPKVCSEYPFFPQEDENGKPILIIANANCPATGNIKNIAQLATHLIEAGAKPIYRSFNNRVLENGEITLENLEPIFEEIQREQEIFDEYGYAPDDAFYLNYD